MRADGRAEGLLARVIRFCIRRRIGVLTAAGAVMLAGAWALSTTPLDAVPDTSDAQVIVTTAYPGQSPGRVEDQVTYPLTTALVGVPGSRTVRGYSLFGQSFVYVIFEDGTDPYWARARVQEAMARAQRRLPQGVTAELGPDGTGVGWVFEYALVSDRHSLQELRSLQDWYLKYPLSSVDGVSEVASLGGYVKQYQVQLDPLRLRAHGLTVGDVAAAVRNSNRDAGGGAIELGEAEFMVAGRGSLRNAGDLRALPVKYDPEAGVSVALGDVAVVAEGPEMRRGVADLDGEGEVAGGIVVMRQGENALEVIENVKRALDALRPGLPEGVRIVATYDRSGLIRGAVRNLGFRLAEEMLVIALVCLLFLAHARSALVAFFTLPAAVLAAFLLMRAQGLSADILSLGGIAIAVGAMVDGALILIENLHKHLEAEQARPPEERRDPWDVVVDAAAEVGPALFGSLLVMTVSFLPVFALGGEEGKLFRPLAYTKTFAMAASALMAVTVVPVLLGYFVRGRVRPERANPVNRWLASVYRPVAEFSLRRPRAVVAAAVVAVAATAYPLSRLGSEYMPPLFEGDLLYMPTLAPGMSIARTRELLQRTDRILASFPEVERVFGKAGRAETATDPAGLDMFETVIRLKPRPEWRDAMTVEKLVAQMDSALRMPGLANAWTMPVKARLDMLSTGIRTPVGVKISGPDLGELQRLGADAEAVLRKLPGTHSAFAERALGGNYVDVDVDRARAGRYGLTVADVQEVIETALGGMPVTTVTEGRERYDVALRYSRSFRDNLPALRRVEVPLPGGGQVPLQEVADITLARRPMMIRTEDARPSVWVFVDLSTSDIGGYARRARSALEALRLPPGYALEISGQYASMERARKTLLAVVPVTLLLIVLLLYLVTRSLARTALVLCAVPFSLIGAVWLLYVLDYQMSVAVWIGLIALAGLDAETGVVMLLYLDRSSEAYASRGELRDAAGLRAAILDGAVRRVRPKIMTAAVILGGLVPILLGSGPGSDVMQRIAAPMAGGVVTSVLMELAVYPALYYLWRRREVLSRGIRE